MDTANGEIRIFIADHQTMFRQAARTLLEREPGLRVVGEAGTCGDVLDHAPGLHPDVLLLNLDLPDLTGTETLRALAEKVSGARTIVLADSSRRRQIVEALKLGASGVVYRNTNAEMLIKSIRTVAAGDYWVGHEDIHELMDSIRKGAGSGQELLRTNGFGLTPRETEIVNLIVDGCSNREIARKFRISEQTVKHHLTSIFEKTGVSNRLELAIRVVQA